MPPLKSIPTAAEILSGAESGSLVPPSRIKPAMAEYYTGRPKYVRLILDLEEVTRQSRRALESMCVLKAGKGEPTAKMIAQLAGVPDQGPRAVKTPTTKMWINKTQMSEKLGVQLKDSQHRSIVNGLVSLAKYAPLVQFYLTKGEKDIGPLDAHMRLAEKATRIVDEYRRDASADKTKQKFFTSKTGVDEEGRIWAKGGRKDSKALVYIAPVEAAAEGVNPLDNLGQVIVNNRPMAEYFSQLKHREWIMHPLRLTHLLGQFNIFTIVSGGGLTGQSGAIAHGVAKAIMRHFEEIEAQRITELEDTTMGRLEDLQKARNEAEAMSNGVRKLLAKDGVLKRDPRMVERKKTGYAKAKKAYTWVKR